MNRIMQMPFLVQTPTLHAGRHSGRRVHAVARFHLQTPARRRHHHTDTSRRSLRHRALYWVAFVDGATGRVRLFAKGWYFQLNSSSPRRTSQSGYFRRALVRACVHTAHRPRYGVSGPPAAQLRVLAMRCAAVQTGHWGRCEKWWRCCAKN